MSAIVYFVKREESDEEVRYAFGRDDKSMSRSLTYDKIKLRSAPDDGQGDAEFRWASQKIRSVYSERGEWPSRGAFVG